MEKKTYTAQEMRELADSIAYVKVRVSDTLCVEQYADKVCSMLRQAAEMRERAEEVRSRHSLYYGKIDYEHETAIVDEVDYILRGDAEKEDK